MMYAKYIVVRHFVLKSLTFEVEIFRTTYVKSGKILVGDKYLFLLDLSSIIGYACH